MRYVSTRTMFLMTCLGALAGCKHNTEPGKSTEGTSSAPPKTGKPSTTLTPTPIPKGYDFPGERLLIQQWADAWNINKITGKAWNLWAGLHAGSSQYYWNGAEIPVWDTWAGEEIFTTPVANASSSKPSHKFHPARQLTHSPPRLKNGAALSSQAAEQIVSFNKFNPAMAQYLTQQHSGPAAGAQYQYTQFKSLAQLNKDWPAQTPIADRKVQEAPYTAPSLGQQGDAAAELKPVMFLVKKNLLTPVPLWQGLSGSNDSSYQNGPSQCQNGPSAECHPAPFLWKTCVLVDPTQKDASPSTLPVAATADQIESVQPLIQAANDASMKANQLPAFSCSQYLYAPLSTIYSIALDADEAASFNQAQGGSGLTATEGDYAVLVAMHVNTKEIINWTWQTFWWQPGSDTPQSFPGSKAGMTSKVTGAAANYAMCTSYNQTQGSQSGAPMVVCFNPYLETSAGIPDGVQSNCMTCHGTATVGSTFEQGGTLSTVSYPSDYNNPIDFNDDPRFAGYTRTDFSWAIPVDPTPVSSSSTR